MVEPEPAYAIDPAPIRPPREGRTGRRRLIGAAIIVLALGAAAVVIAASRLVPPGTAPARIVLVEPDGRLAIIDGQGGGRLPLASPDTTYIFPAWSPDRTRVAAIGQTQDGATVEVFAATADGGSGPSAGRVIYRSVASAPFYLYWTPDGRGVTFLTSERDSIALRTAPADGSAEATILRTGSPMYWAWRDPTHMLVHTGADARAFLGEVAGDGRTITTVGDVPGTFRSPAVTPDGRLQAWVVETPDGSERIVAAAPDGSARHEAPVSGPTAVGFAPDGSALAFIGPSHVAGPPPFPFGPLEVMDTRSGEIRTLIEDPMLAFFWAPDGRTIAALGPATPGTPGTARRGRTLDATGREIARGTTLDPGNVRARPGGPQAVPVIARPGPPTRSGAADQPGFDMELRLVDVPSGTVTPSRTVRVTDVFVSQLLPYFDQYALSHRLWAPDGGSLLLPVVADDGADRLQAFGADGSAPRDLAPGAIGFWTP